MTVPVEARDVWRSFGISRPRLSSDTCLRLAGADGMPLLGGVADMIGRPTGLPWRNYMRTALRQIGRRLSRAGPIPLDALCETLREELLAHNRRIRDIADRYDRTAFGFCIALALRDGDRCRMVWLGDCRAYAVRRTALHPAAFSCRALTRDHNALDRAVRDAPGPVTLFRHEILRLGRQLHLFLGSDEAHVREALRTEWADTTLAPGELLLMMTDGLFVPLLRSEMDRTNDRLDADSLYLEEALAAWLAARPDAGQARAPWEAWVRGLVRDVEAYSRRHPGYRDDIAVCGLYRDAPQERSDRPAAAKRLRLFRR